MSLLRVEPIPEVEQAYDEAFAGTCVEDEPDRVLAIADAQGVDLAARPPDGDARAHLEHVCAEDLRFPGPRCTCSPP